MGCAIRNRIRELRPAHGDMTPAGAGGPDRVTRQTVNAIELEKYSPTLEMAFRIAAVFEAPLGDVFQFEGEPR